MRCLVDKSVPNAQVYYEKYLREPSPAGDITIGTQDILATDDLDLKLLLEEMKKLGAKGELLVATHSNPKGLLMKLIKGGGASAEFGVMEKIIEGKLGSFYSQFVLLDQPYIRDDKVTVSQLVAQASAKTGENIQISRFVRFRVGEGNE